MSVSDPVSASMNFLNEVAGRFPDAISLAAGRPFDEFHAVDDIDKHVQAYLTHLRERGLSEAQSRQLLTQYGRTNGHLGGLIARMLDVDEDIHVPDEAVMVTAGCQEAMVIALRGLCAGPGRRRARRRAVLRRVHRRRADAGHRRGAGARVAGRAATRRRSRRWRRRGAGRRAPPAGALPGARTSPTRPGVSLPVPVRRALLDVARPRRTC